MTALAANASAQAAQAADIAFLARLSTLTARRQVPVLAAFRKRLSPACSRRHQAATLFPFRVAPAGLACRALVRLHDRLARKQAALSPILTSCQHRLSCHIARPPPTPHSPHFDPAQAA